MSILAIDYGKKRIGLAVSSTFIATPLESILADKPETVFAKISEIIKEYVVCEIVIGLPLNMNDTESEMTKEVRSFAGVIEKKLQIKVGFADERLTSRDAESKLALSEKNWRKRKKKIDSASACLILQNYLDRKDSHR
ncbi:MAG: Holliday junction resolvase RuvX [Elusimicrobiota bacterium]|nr:Holliday junction resolvase RuvX [Elusimicrobiota bacterium]